MERVLYVVSRDQPMLSGYLMTTVGARASDGRPVAIKVDERRAERRRSPDARQPERRRGERRLRPSLGRELHSRGYATVVVQSAADTSWPVEPAPAMAWRPRSTWRQRVARLAQRSRVWWGVAAILIAAFGVAIAIARSVHWTPAPPSVAPSPSDPSSAASSGASPSAAAPSASVQAIAPRTEKASPLPRASKAETFVPAVPPTPSRPAPARIVSTRSSGVVLSVDPKARVLVLNDGGVAGDAGRLRVELAPDARVVLSERDDQAQDPSRPFKDTVISLADVRRGDYVVVERRGPEGKELARSLVVTFRPIK